MGHASPFAKQPLESASWASLLELKPTGPRVVLICKVFLTLQGLWSTRDFVTALHQTHGWAAGRTYASRGTGGQGRATKPQLHHGRKPSTKQELFQHVPLLVVQNKTSERRALWSATCLTTSRLLPCTVLTSLSCHYPLLFLLGACKLAANKNSIVQKLHC